MTQKGVVRTHGMQGNFCFIQRQQARNCFPQEHLDGNTCSSI
jgi:hypothetical protein